MKIEVEKVKSIEVLQEPYGFTLNLTIKAGEITFPAMLVIGTDNTAEGFMLAHEIYVNFIRKFTEVKNEESV
jgi:hypothetical protein